MGSNFWIIFLELCKYQSQLGWLSLSLFLLHQTDDMPPRWDLSLSRPRTTNPLCFAVPPNLIIYIPRNLDNDDRAAMLAHLTRIMPRCWFGRHLMANFLSDEVCIKMAIEEGLRIYAHPVLQDDQKYILWHSPPSLTLLPFCACPMIHPYSPYFDTTAMHVVAPALSGATADKMLSVSAAAATRNWISRNCPFQHQGALLRARKWSDFCGKRRTKKCQWKVYTLHLYMQQATRLISIHLYSFARPDRSQMSLLVWVRPAALEGVKEL